MPGPLPMYPLTRTPEHEARLQHHLLLDHGSPHAPKPLGTWIASRALSFAVKMYGLPTYARWLE